MTSPSETERVDLENLVEALNYAQSTQAILDALSALAGVTTEGIELLLGIPQVRGLMRLDPRAGASASVQAMHRINLMRRAAYLAQAARRMSTAARMGPDERARATTTERRWLSQHLRAMSQRAVAASQVAAQVRILQRRSKIDGVPWSGVLGWYAVMDERTSGECKQANGRNFNPNRIPLIGFPGAVHPDCRCRPGPPHNTSKRVETVRPDPADVLRRRTGPVRVTIGA